MYYSYAFVETCASSKYLGIKLDTKLDFKLLIISTKPKIFRSVGILSQLRSLFPSSTLLLLYFTLIHPRLPNGLPLRGCTFGSYLKKLQSLQTVVPIHVEHWGGMICLFYLFFVNFEHWGGCCSQYICEFCKLCQTATCQLQSSPALDGVRLPM